MFPKLFPLVLLFLCLHSGALAQYASKKCRWEKLGEKPIILDSLSVDQNSIHIQGLADSLYSYNINSGILEINPLGAPDSVFVCYRVLPFKLSEIRYRRSMAEYDSNAMFKTRRPNLLPTPKEELFHSPDLNKTGSLSRGISFGNTQNVFVNSALNLQLEGKISDDINIRAVISDQNIPLQPEGNTQQLQEFDKVYIQLYNEHASLTAGDVVLQNKASHFLRYYKNVQGGQLDTRYKIMGGSDAETSVSFSVAKGKFASTIVPVIEGVLGPYRLRGPDNERFIIVLANSERVFLDGVLLQRGFDYDYVIDYNLGEISFTPKVIITRYSRLRIDFEYAERNYSRSIMNANHYQKAGKVDFYLNMYAEKDNPHQPLSFGLTDVQKNFLSQIGDNLELAQIPAFDSVAFAQNRILYKREKFEHDGQTYLIFKHTIHPDSARFSVVFSEVGAGNGNYTQVSINANGRVFQFVPPINGISQGTFEPVRQIPLPTKKQMMTGGINYEISDHDKVFGEVAFSEHDLNRYSNVDSHDDAGKAFKVGYKMTGRRISFLDKYKLNTLIDYEYNDENFKPIDRYRFIEFDRDWSFDPLNSEEKAEDHIFNWSSSLERNMNNRIEYKFSVRNRGEEVNGVQHHLNISKQLNRLQVSSQNFLMHNNKSFARSEWFRSFTDIHFTSGIFVPGYEFRVDKNQEKANETGKVISSAMNYHEHRVYLKNNDSLDVRFDLSHSYRIDNDTLLNNFVPSTRANTTSLSLATDVGALHTFNMLFTYRDLENLNVHGKEEGNKREESIMGRIDWMGNLFKKHMRSELTYAIGNGRELKREFVYLLVPVGEGTHTWRDDNGDNIQDLNEFYEAINADERTYARIFVPTDEYILAYSTNFNYRLNIDMPRVWKSAGGMKGFLSRFSNNTSWSIDKKTTDPDFENRLTPFRAAIKDEDLLSIRENFRSTLFYNRANPKFGVDGGLLMTEFKQLLTSGFETQQNTEYKLNTRYNIQKIYNIGLQSTSSLRSGFSDFMEGRNFSIKSRKISPEIAWQPSSHFRLTGSYSLSARKNILLKESLERADFDEYAMDVRIAKASKATFNAVVRYIHIDFEGQANTPVGYALLDALQPGNNMTWSLTLQQKLTSGIQMNINYEGRKSGDIRMIHIGRMQVNALF